LMNCV